MQGRGGEMMEPEGTGDLAAASDMVWCQDAQKVLECPVLGILDLKGALVALKGPAQLEGLSS